MKQNLEHRAISFKNSTELWKQPGTLSDSSNECQYGEQDKSGEIGQNVQQLAQYFYTPAHV